MSASSPVRPSVRSSSPWATRSPSTPTLWSRRLSEAPPETRTRYVDLHRSGELAARARALRALEAACEICPRRCLARRAEGETGHCGMGAEARVASAGPHHGEERALRGEGGSGTIFLAGCSLGCLYCQNWEISHEREGRAAGTRRIADLMLGVQAEGCHNINWVTPTHAMASLVEALDLAAAEGLKVPLVYNSSAYERVESLRLLDGVVDERPQLGAYCTYQRHRLAIHQVSPTRGPKFRCSQIWGTCWAHLPLCVLGVGLPVHPRRGGLSFGRAR